MLYEVITSFCPVTGQPDYYTVTIDYVPGALCIESKSLKLYLWHFRERRIFAESLAVEIKEKVVQTIAPQVCTVTALQKSRGGIVIEAVARYAADSSYNFV